MLERVPQQPYRELEEITTKTDTRDILSHATRQAESYEDYFLVDSSRAVAPKSMTPSRPSASSAEVARVRVGVQQPGPLGPGEVQDGQQLAGPVALVLAAVGDDPRQRGALEPLGDEDLRRAGHDRGTRDLRVAGVRGGERPLRVGLQPVVQLLDDPGLELGDQRLDVHAREQGREHAGEPGQLVEVGHQRRRPRPGTGS